MSNKPVTPDEFLKHYEECLNDLTFGTDESTKDAYVVLIRGKRATLRSGKSLWKSKGAAKSALRNHLHYAGYRNKCYVMCSDGSISSQGSPTKDYALQSQLVKQAEDEWIDKNVVIMPLSKWIDHRRKATT